MRDHLVQPAFSKDPPYSTMPVDKQTCGTPAKPFTPTLSTAFRTSKSPLTPRLAGSKEASPVSPPRRVPRSETAAAPSSRREDFRSPTASKLSGNVTPRSGARVSRIGGDSPSTPGSSHKGTPSKARPLSAIELSKPRRYNGTGTGLGIQSIEKKQNTQVNGPNVAGGPVLSSGLGRRVSTGSPRSAGAEPTSTRLFHVKNTQPSSSSELEETTGTRKLPTFFYASETTRRTDSPEPIRTTPDKLPNEEEQGQFCYATDTPSNQSSTFRKSINGAKTSAPAISSPISRPLITQGTLQTPQQPSFPTKAASLRSAPASLSFATGNSIKAKINDGPAKPRTPLITSDTPCRASTSSKTSTVRQPAPRKLSIATAAPSTPPRRAEPQFSPKATGSPSVPQRAIPPSPTQRFSPRSTSLSSSNTGMSTRTLDSTPSTSLHPLSPVKIEAPPSTLLQRTDELAANARRERKVLDLEISNSSLLAINRTLEREMHKQSLELRRFRRQSRADRMSLASGSMRSLSGQTGLSNTTDPDNDFSARASLSDLGEETNSSEEDEEDDLDSSYNSSSPLHSPTSTAPNESRRRARDEKRLLHDLTKHQQLLIDSQKITQSIKRCLNWTEELITEGRKALAYNVKVSDVELGGKVLAHNHGDEGEDRCGGGGSKALLSLSPSPAVATPNEVKQERSLWRRGLEEMELEVDRMLESSSTLKQVVPA
jgi:hypothetical protein